ncbi:hypothetical protein [Nonomuraea aridisoli]|uniref:hypothetical protein n=1 Tax=Nonomuraea aridisoli TaxID=2070368 RepID=UPI0015E88354|nr:hypothetical protein [Nonomuraea aridisoli]
MPFSLSLSDLVQQPHTRGEEVAVVVDEHDTPSALRGADGWELDASLRIDEIALTTGAGRCSRPGSGLGGRRESPPSSVPGRERAGATPGATRHRGTLDGRCRFAWLSGIVAG